MMKTFAMGIGIAVLLQWGFLVATTGGQVTGGSLELPATPANNGVLIGFDDAEVIRAQWRAATADPNLLENLNRVQIG